MEIGERPAVSDHTNDKSLAWNLLGVGILVVVAAIGLWRGLSSH